MPGALHGVRAEIMDAFPFDQMRPVERLYLLRGEGLGTTLWVPGLGWQVFQEGAAIDVSAPPPYVELPLGTREALIELLAPHADAGEVRALHDALDVERARIDKVLDRRVTDLG